MSHSSHSPHSGSCRAFRMGATACILAAAGLALSCDPAGLETDQRQRVAATGPELAVAWSELAAEIATAEDGFQTFKGQRALAMMHLAVHDALQAVVPVYAPFAYEAAEPDADPVVAAARAAHDVLLAAYPDRQADVDAALAGWLDGVADGAAQSLGEEVGAESAQAIIALRMADGWDAPGTYAFEEGPGEYRTTPPWDGFTLQPGFRHATPFSVEDPASFRPPAPPALASPAYAQAVAEVQAQGDSMSAARTADETGYAVWWMEYSESLVGRLARGLLAERAADLWQANRVLAHLYVALFDGYIANWDSKYEYNHWRPYTAIREAALDGNAGTAPDPAWRPLRPTPPFPEYASAHATGCAAAFEVMAATFGDEATFESTSITAPAGMPTRTFTSFRGAAAECGDSRVQIGWHYRYSVDAGLEAGRAVAQHVLRTTLAER
jgi:hypothetical protein